MNTTKPSDIRLTSYDFLDIHKFSTAMSSPERPEPLLELVENTPLLYHYGDSARQRERYAGDPERIWIPAQEAPTEEQLKGMQRFAGSLKRELTCFNTERSKQAVLEAIITLFTMLNAEFGVQDIMKSKTKMFLKLLMGEPELTLIHAVQDFLNDRVDRFSAQKVPTIAEFKRHLRALKAEKQSQLNRVNAVLNAEIVQKRQPYAVTLEEMYRAIQEVEKELEAKPSVIGNIVLKNMKQNYQRQRETNEKGA